MATLGLNFKYAAGKNKKLCFCSEGVGKPKVVDSHHDMNIVRQLDSVDGGLLSHGIAK